MDFDDVHTKFDGWSFAQSFPGERAIELLKWRSFASLAEEILKGEVHCAAWESFEGDRLRGCWRVAFKVRVSNVGICDAFYNAPAGYRAQFARSPEHGVASNRWLLARLEPRLLQSCRERGIDTNPVKYSLQGDQAKVWIVEPKDDSHIKGAPAICCHQWSGPGLCADRNAIGRFAPRSPEHRRPCYRRTKNLRAVQLLVGHCLNGAFCPTILPLFHG